MGTVQAVPVDLHILVDSHAHLNERAYRIATVVESANKARYPLLPISLFPELEEELPKDDKN